MQRCWLPIVGSVFVAVRQPTWFLWLLGRDEITDEMSGRIQGDSNPKPVSDSAFDARIRVVCERSQY